MTLSQPESMMMSIACVTTENLGAGELVLPSLTPSVEELPAPQGELTPV